MMESGGGAGTMDRGVCGYKSGEIWRSECVGACAIVDCIVHHGVIWCREVNRISSPMIELFGRSGCVNGVGSAAIVSVIVRCATEFRGQWEFLVMVWERITRRGHLGR